ncbi:MAG: ATP-binding protein, partial [Methanococcaceae archaeon]
DYRQHEKQTDGEFARNKRTLPWEREFIRKDGLPVPVLVGTAALKDNDNTVIGFVLDLRERKLAEEALRENEAALSGFFNAKDVLMCVLELDDTDFVYLLPNAKMAQMFGFEIAEMAGSRGRELGLSEAGAELWCSYMKKSLATGETVTFEHLINYRGKETWFISSISLIEDNSSPRPRFSFTASDITERKKAERELEQYKHHLENTVEERTQKLKEVNSLLQGEVIKLKLAEEEIQDQLNFLQILLDTIPNPIFFKNTESRYVDCNRSFAEFFDITRHIIKNREVYEIFPQEIALRDNENDQILLKTSQAQLIELNYTNKYGNQKDIIINKAIFPKSDGSIGGIVGVVIDITEQKRLETEIKKALDKEKELVELKSGFISTASHEFRTPLTSILASSDLLEMFGRSWKEEKYFEHIKKIHNGVQYMTELLDDVLTVSKAETGRLECNPVQINLYRLCCDILEHVKVRKTGGHELNFDFPNISFTVGLDEKLVKHILLNLLSNAVKYSPDGGKIDFCVDVKENKVIFIIRDEGIGIGEEDMKNLFEPFHRGSNIGNISGTGLGLSIVKKSVELHKGTISVKSSLGKGTEFVIAIPYKKDIQQ